MDTTATCPCCGEPDPSHDEDCRQRPGYEPTDAELDMHSPHGSSPRP